MISFKWLLLQIAAFLAYSFLHPNFLVGGMLVTVFCIAGLGVLSNLSRRSPPARAKDAYDMAVEYLTRHPDEIVDAWYQGVSPTPWHPAWFLFSGIGQNRFCSSCPTVTRGCDIGVHPDLRGLLNDDRIPTLCAEITVDSLPAFAEWQRKADRAHNRPTPIWTEFAPQSIK